jgi:ferric-dicitrate binding protein FerR (iron transport regulator)
MNENHNIETQNWEKLAKSVFDSQDENTSNAESEILTRANEQQQISDLVKNIDLYFELKKYPANEAWEKVYESIHKQPKQTVLRKILLNPYVRTIAAVLVVALLVVGGYETIFNKNVTVQKLEMASTGEVITTYTLPDGTIVSLNSNTILKYPKKFGKNTREVTIEGEAFFEVKPDKNKPFIIHAGEAQIKVLGTSFNVNAYPNAPSVEVIVETGKVQVMSTMNENTENNELILIPGDKATLVLANKELLKSTNDNPNFIAWKTRNLTFRATSLDEVISTLQNVYKVNIRFDNASLGKLQLTAQFNDYPLDFILKVIESTFQVEAQRINGQYVLKAKS